MSDADSVSESVQGEKDIQPYFKPLFHLVPSGRETQRGSERERERDTNRWEEGEIKTEWNIWATETKKMPGRKEEWVN